MNDREKMKLRPSCAQKCPKFQFLRKILNEKKDILSFENEIYQKLMRIHVLKQYFTAASRNPQWRTKVNENFHFVLVHFIQYH